MCVCTYDNPATFRRECWSNGKIIYSYDARLWFYKVFPLPARVFFFGANIGDWKEGQIVGDTSAIAEEE